MIAKHNPIILIEINPVFFKARKIDNIGNLFNNLLKNYRFEGNQIVSNDIEKTIVKKSNNIFCYPI